VVHIRFIIVSCLFRFVVMWVAKVQQFLQSAKRFQKISRPAPFGATDGGKYAAVPGGRLVPPSTCFISVYLDVCLRRPIKIGKRGGQYFVGS